MKIGIVCYPTFGGSGVVATELGKALAKKGHEVHFITYSAPSRLDFFNQNLFYHEVSLRSYPLFEYPPYELALASKMVNVVAISRSSTCCMYIMPSRMRRPHLWQSKSCAPRAFTSPW